MVTYRISKEHNNHPNLTIYDTLVDGVLAGWKITANDGYVFYDTNEEIVEVEEGAEEVQPEIYYSTEGYFPLTLDWSAFGITAVLESSTKEE